jgi:hypothetical protein
MTGPLGIEIKGGGPGYFFLRFTTAHEGGGSSTNVQVLSAAELLHLADVVNGYLSDIKQDTGHSHRELPEVEL